MPVIPLTAARELIRASRQAYLTRVQKGRAFYQLKKQSVKGVYHRYEKYVPIVAFVAGFAYDSLTLTRIDLLLDNLILLGYTIGAGVLIAVLGMVERGRIRRAWIINHRDLIAGVTHFFLGGLLSSKKNIAAGKWRVEVKTTKGRLLGRIPLEIITTEEHPKQFKIDYR